MTESYFTFLFLKMQQVRKSEFPQNVFVVRNPGIYRRKRERIDPVGIEYKPEIYIFCIEYHIYAISECAEPSVVQQRINIG